jgi:hypothetical protein
MVNDVAYCVDHESVADAPCWILFGEMVSVQTGGFG